MDQENYCMKLLRNMIFLTNSLASFRESAIGKAFRVAIAEGTSFKGHFSQTFFTLCCSRPMFVDLPPIQLSKCQMSKRNQKRKCQAPVAVTSLRL
jgi:hypothetical protein